MTQIRWWTTTAALLLALAVHSARAEEGKATCAKEGTCCSSEKSGCCGSHVGPATGCSKTAAEGCSGCCSQAKAQGCSECCPDKKCACCPNGCSKDKTAAAPSCCSEMSGKGCSGCCSQAKAECCSQEKKTCSECCPDQKCACCPNCGSDPKKTAAGSPKQVEMLFSVLFGNGQCCFACGSEKKAESCSKCCPDKKCACCANCCSDKKTASAASCCSTKKAVSCAECCPDKKCACCAKCVCKKDSKPVVSAGGKCGKEVIEKRLLTPISINFRETSLLQVLKELGAAHHLNIVADESALEEAGISLDRPLTVKLEDVELKSVLGLLLEMTHHHLAYVIQDGAVVVTTRARTHGKVVGKTYNVEDLESFHLNGQPWNPEEIIKFIIENIEPESWRCLGGAGTIDYFPLSKALVVNQPADIQEQVMDVLTSLRRLKGEPDLPPAPGLAMDMPLWTPPLLPVPYPVPFLAFPPLPPMPPPPPEPGFHMVQGVPPVRGIYGPMMPELLPAPRLLQQPAIPVQEARQVRECPAFNGEFLYHYQARPEHNGQGSPEFLYFHPLFRNASQGKAEVVDTASNGPATGMWVERRDLTPPPMPPLSDFRAGIAPATCVAPAVGVPSSEAERPSTHSSGGHSDSWTMKVVLEEGHALLEVQGPGESRLTCERTTLKNSGGSPLKIHVAENDTQVAVSSSALNALADSLIEQNGCLVLEGHVKLVYSKDTQRADVVADRVLINLASGNLEIAPGTCTTPQAGSEAMQKANFSFWVGTFH